MTSTDTWTTLLSGVVGSQAYGLARPDSDVDVLTVAAAPTEEFHGLSAPVGKRASHVTTSPDVTVHEAAKYVNLCLAANPTVTELLWLPDDCYRVRHPYGVELLTIRQSLLGARRVRDAYLGYASAQFKKLAQRGTTFSSDTRARTEKHARHLLRLIDGGTQLYLTGHLDVRLSDPDRYYVFGQEVATYPEQGLKRAEELLASATRTIDDFTSPLPKYADPTHAEKWLRSVRQRMFMRQHLLCN